MSHPNIAFRLAIALAGVIATRNQAAGASKAEESLAQAASNQQYAFVLFYKEDNPAKRTLAQTLQQGLSQHDGKAIACSVAVQDPTEKALVKRFGVSRAPLPMVVAVAPNGAITAVLLQKATPAQVSSAFVTSAMADCMKAMEDDKVVFVCIKQSSQSRVPAAIAEFQSDPEFKNRSRLIEIQSNDEGEEAFFKQMEIDPSTVDSSTIVFLAPPGVLVGKFGSSVTKSELAKALHGAGKCCEDPNCKHGQGPQAAKPSKTKRN